MRAHKAINPPSTYVFALLLAGSIGLSGCVDPEYNADGEVVVCFEKLGDAENNPLENDLNEVLNGTIVFDKPIAATNVDLHCSSTAQRVLQIDAEGEIWNVGYAARNGNGEDITPEVDFAHNQPVRLSLVRQSSFGTYYAFAARSQDGVLLAMNDGFGAKLRADSVEGLSVTRGDTTGATKEDDCGTRAAHELIFKAQTSTTVDGGQTNIISLDEGPASVMNVAAWSYEGSGCLDVWGPDAWMAWREAPL